MVGRVSRVPDWVGPATLATLVILLHGRALGLGLIADDFDLLRAIAAPTFAFTDPFPAGTGFYFRPGVLATLHAEVRLTGSSFVHHASNLAMHAVNALLIFATTRALGSTRLLAFALALLFCVHPANVPDVYWISGRTDLLCTIGYLLSLFSLSRMLRAGSGTALVLGCAVGALLALSAKELAVTLGVEMAVLTLLLRERAEAPLDSRRRRAVWVGLTTVAVLTVLYVAYVQGRFGGPSHWAGNFGVPGVARTAAAFVALLLVPLPEYVLASVRRGHASLIAATTGLVALVTAGWFLLAALRGKRAVAQKALILFAALAIPLAPLASDKSAPSARQIYLPFAVACVVAAAVVPSRWSKWVSAALFVACAGLSIRSVMVGGAWVRGVAIANRHCETFRQHTRGVPRGTPIAVLTYPAMIDDAPVFSNDLGTALHYCIHGALGVQPLVHGYGEIAAPGVDDIAKLIRSDDEQARVFGRRLDSPHAHFADLPGRLGAAFDDGFARITITQVDEAGRVRGMEVGLPPGPMLVLDSDGGGFFVAGVPRQ